MNNRAVLLPFLAGAAVVALIATSVTAVAQSRRAAEAEERVSELRAEVAELRAQVEELEARGPLDGILDGLLGGGNADLGGLLDGLLGGGGDGLLDGLLGSGGIPGADCLMPGGMGDLGGLLDGLLGGDGGDLGGLLDGLLGGDLDDLGGLLDGDLGGLLGGEGGDLGGLLDDLLGTAGTTHDTTGVVRVAQRDDDPEAVVREIARQVEQMRELDFTTEVSVDFLTSDELSVELERILDDALDLDELAVEQTLLATLGALPADADLERMNRDLLDEQVAGFYDPDDGRLVVLVPEDGAIRPTDRIIVAHELEHALADQAIGLPDLDGDLDADAALAQLSVVEGDATLLMNLWALEHLSFQEQLGLAGDADIVAQQEMLERFPIHLQRQLLFPYTEGLELVCQRYLDAGWSGVDELYEDGPATSVEVMFPDRLGEEAADVADLTAPRGGDLAYDDTLGAAPLSWLFEAPGGDPDRGLDDPRERAGAWTGGRAQLWQTGDGPVVGLALRGGGDGPDLCGSVTAWYDAATPDADAKTAEGATVFDGAQPAVIRCDGDDVRVAIAPDVATATRVVSG